MLFIALFVAWTPRLHDVWAAGVANVNILINFRNLTPNHTSLLQNSTMFVENCEKFWWLNALYLNNFRTVIDIVRSLLALLLTYQIYFWQEFTAHVIVLFEQTRDFSAIQSRGSLRLTLNSTGHLPSSLSLSSTRVSEMFECDDHEQDVLTTLNKIYG